MYEVLRTYPFAGPLHRSSEGITLECRKDSTPGLLQCRAGWGKRGERGDNHSRGGGQMQGPTEGSY